MISWIGYLVNYKHLFMFILMLLQWGLPRIWKDYLIFQVGSSADYLLKKLLSRPASVVLLHVLFVTEWQLQRVLWYLLAQENIQMILNLLKCNLLSASFLVYKQFVHFDILYLYFYFFSWFLSGFLDIVW